MIAQTMFTGKQTLKNYSYVNIEDFLFVFAILEFSIPNNQGNGL